MNNPFEYVPEEECGRAFRELLRSLDRLKGSDDPADVNFCRELEAGKMLGVLIAEDDAGGKHTLYAFSGQLGHGGFYHRGFVGPVFDYLRPDGYFKTHEAEISRHNSEISHYEEKILSKIENEYALAKERTEAEVAEYKKACNRSKSARDARRKSGEADEVELAEMIRQSQFEKAELHRLKKRVSATLAPYEAELERAKSRLAALKEKRRADSEALQEWLFTNFRLLNAKGESRSLSDIFADTAMKIPPSGAGECCGPKLLQAAYLQGLHPVSIAEYWYGAPKGGEVRRHGEHYPACRGKCLPVLNWMLQGLKVDPPLENTPEANMHFHPEIIYGNDRFCVVDKPSGMLSVPGKGSAVSVQRWLEERYGSEREVKMAHRLDRDTSGLIIATFDPLSFKTMQSLFATRRVHKTYEALLNGDYRLRAIPRQGRINIPLSPDRLDRPRQRVDLEDGKEAVTEYEFISVLEGKSRVRFTPHTGRTHQLRVHAASEQGLGLPIVGDPLYGSDRADASQRLMLHARRIEFTFPLDGRHYTFESPVPF